MNPIAYLVIIAGTLGPVFLWCFVASWRRTSEQLAPLEKELPPLPGRAEIAEPASAESRDGARA